MCTKQSKCDVITSLEQRISARQSELTDAGRERLDQAVLDTIRAHPALTPVLLMWYLENTYPISWKDSDVKDAIYRLTERKKIKLNSDRTFDLIAGQ